MRIQQDLRKQKKKWEYVPRFIANATTLTVCGRQSCMIIWQQADNNTMKWVVTQLVPQVQLPFAIYTVVVSLYRSPSISSEINTHTLSGSTGSLLCLVYWFSQLILWSEDLIFGVAVLLAATGCDWFLLFISECDRSGREVFCRSLIHPLLTPWTKWKWGTH